MAYKRNPNKQPTFGWYHRTMKQGTSSLTVTIPQYIVGTLELEYGDYLEIKLEDSQITMRKT